MDYINENRKIWDQRSINNDRWSVPVSPEVMQKARPGEWNILLTPSKPVPHDWLPEPLSGKRILCLAGGGGQQGPVLAALGAQVTVFDNSGEQLEKDVFVAKREGLTIQTIQGNMQNLSIFSDESFDCIVHPWSNGYVDNILPVWKECARVLKKHGILLAGFGNPIEYIFDPKELEDGRFHVKYKIPYCDIEHLDDKNVLSVCRTDGYIWSHTLAEQLQGQIDAGFVIAGFYEDQGGTALDQYINSSMATKAIKL